MNVHEYQAKELFRQFGVPVPEGTAADTPERAREIADSLKTDFYVVKAQIHSGGRGKAGGVKLVNTPAEVEQAARDLIGRTLVTHQTGPAGKQVRTVSVDIAYKPERELYVSILVDRGTSRPTFLVSTEGGMDIEQVAASTPEKIVREPIDPAIGMQPYQARKLAYALGLGGEFLKPTVKLLQALYRSFMATDASLIEVNPLIVTDTGAVLALDAKMNFDDNALFRHQDILGLRDVHEEDPREVEASKHNLSYIGLDGNIGCMVNGAGLAMATMDTIKTCGGEPANFLDVGGGATTEQVTEAFKILCGDPNVKAILVNIFGGIMKCDVIAAGILTAAREVGVSVPLVVRLEGTNVKEGKEALAASDLAIIAADSMADAGRKVVDAAA